MNVLIYICINIVVIFIFHKFIFKGEFKLKELIKNMICLNGIILLTILLMIVLPYK
jgi:hypothetical protein